MTFIGAFALMLMVHVELALMTAVIVPLMAWLTSRYGRRMTKTWQGFARAAFTNADNYVVQLHRPLEGPLGCLILAAGVSVDTALSQER